MKKPIVTRYHIPTKGQFQKRPLRIVHLSDLHNTLYDREQQTLIQMIKNEYPDLILLTGDMFDSRRSHRATMLLLRGIRDLAPIYFVTGNHEYDPGVSNRLAMWLRRFGVHFLEDCWEARKIRGEKVLLAGVSDPARWLVDYHYSQTAAMEEEFAALWGREGYKILLTHRPERIHHYLDYPFDLILAGHTHGGQVRIPFSNQGLYARQQGILPLYARGLYRFGSRRMIVSCGLSHFATLPRVLNPPELVVITVGGK